jgi:RNA polymerase sigma factor (sigma-70 family)
MLQKKNNQILEAIRLNNNDLVLNQLYKELLPSIKKLILKNGGSDEEAKDIFQDAVLILYNQVKLNRFDESKEIGAFVYSVARNLWINRAKKLNRQSSLTEAHLDSQAYVSPLSDLITSEKETAIATLMNGVGEECKQLLKYSTYEKLSMKEIAEKMNLSSDGVARTYNYRCKQKLAELIKKNPSLIALFKS